MLRYASESRGGADEEEKQRRIVRRYSCKNVVCVWFKKAES